MIIVGKVAKKQVDTEVLKYNLRNYKVAQNGLAFGITFPIYGVFLC